MGMADRLNAGPYPVSIHTSPFSLPITNSRSTESPDGILLSVAHLAENAQLLLRMSPCGEHLRGIDFVQPAIQMPIVSLGDGASEAVVEMPPLPGSAELFLSALMGVGAWQLARQSRDIRFGPWPAWYQTGEPIQVRHMFAFDVRFVTAPLRTMQAEATPIPQSCFQMRSDRPRLLSEWAGSVVGARAPPFAPIRHIYHRGRTASEPSDPARGESDSPVREG